MEKPAMNQFFDRCIKEALRSKAEEITPSRALHERIKAEINDKEREYISMNRIFKLRRMKPVAIVALVLILSAATCFATTKITSLVSASTDAFDQYPTQRQVEKAVNYLPDYVENFSNGFYFESAAIGVTAAMDGDNNKVNEGKSITFFYTTDNSQKGQMLTLSADLDGPGMTEEPGQNEEVIKEGSLDLIYSQVTFKLVPDDYTPTEEENRQMEQGTLWISSGADEVEISSIQYVRWVKDGIVYNLSDQGYSLGKGAILEMAGEVFGQMK